MATINCPHCGKEMYEMLDTCPNCGGPVMSEALRMQKLQAQQAEQMAYQQNYQQVYNATCKKEKNALLLCLGGGLFFGVACAGAIDSFIGAALFAVLMTFMMGGVMHGFYCCHLFKKLQEGGIVYMAIGLFMGLFYAYKSVFYLMPRGLIRIFTKKPFLTQEEFNKMME